MCDVITTGFLEAMHTYNTGSHPTTDRQ